MTKSVFTTEDDTVPVMNQSPFPSMPQITFCVDGVEKLLNELDITKATRPDKIPNRALKLATKQIAPVLTFIFGQTYEEGVLPEDWRQANIAAIYKK